MQISGGAYVVQLAQQEPAQKQAPAAAAVQGASAAGRVLNFDPVDISSKARELDKFKRDMAALPEVRLDRVALARQNLRDGGYRVDPSLLAQKMMAESVAVRGDSV